MVNVHYMKQEDVHLLEVLGHANFKPHGTDIVCSAISIITYTLVEAINQLPLEQVRRTIHFKEGAVHIMLKTSKNTTQEVKDMAKTFMEMALIGYGLIAADYPANICVNI